MTNSLTIGLVQMPCAVDLQENRNRAEAGVVDCARRGAEIVCLQELFASQYFCKDERHENFALAESIPGPSTDQFSRLAKKLGVVIIVPLFERRTPGLFHNSAVVIDGDGSLLGVYRKMHIPDDPGFMEKFYFTPGDTGFRAFKTQKGPVGVLICWDQWFPEGARLTALAGAQILFYPTAIGWKPEEPENLAVYRDSWTVGMRAHALHNGVFVAAANRVGQEGSLRFWGSSFVADPFGQLEAVAGDGEENLVVPCDLGKIEQTRIEWPFFRDRRVDAYSNLLKLYAEES